MHFRELGLINVLHDYLSYLEQVSTYMFETRKEESIQVQWSKDILRYGRKTRLDPISFHDLSTSGPDLELRLRLPQGSPRPPTTMRQNCF